MYRNNNIISISGIIIWQRYHRQYRRNWRINISYQHRLA